MRIELTCAICGSNHFSLDEAQEDDALVSCEDCGHLVGTLGQLKERVVEQLLARGRNRGLI